MVRSFFVVLICVVFVATGRIVAAQEQRRVALVIGNGVYDNVISLDNPENDARLIATTLQDLDFELIGLEALLNLDFVAMRKAMSAFARALKEPDTVGLFYYAGHAIEVEGRNFMVPVNAGLTDALDVPVELVDVNLLLDLLRRANNDFNMVLLDACRNNPFKKTRGIGSDGGLGQIKAPAGTLISFATSPGGVAADGEGLINSPYTAALAQSLQTPNMGVLEVFNQVGVRVAKATDGEQEPWMSSSPISGQFYFRQDAAVTAAPAPQTSSSAPPSAGPAPDTVFWQSIADSKDPGDYEVYLAEFPNGRFARLARRRLGKLQAGPDKPEPPVRTVVLVPPPLEVIEQDQSLTVLRRANARSKPSTDSDVVATLSPGTSVAVTGKVADRDWLRVRLGGSVAYVWAPLLGDAPRSAPVDPAAMQWAALRGSGDPAALEAFADRFPGTRYAATALARAETIRQQLVAQRRQRQAAARESKSAAVSTAAAPAKNRAVRPPAAPLDGQWRGRATLSAGPGECPPYFNLRITISGKKFSGSARSSSDQFEVEGKFSGQDKIEGVVFNNIGLLTFTARYRGDEWRGSWQAEGECDGSIRLSRAP